jgi:hypothetical protein
MTKRVGGFRLTPNFWLRRPEACRLRATARKRVGAFTSFAEAANDAPVPVHFPRKQTSMIGLTIRERRAVQKFESLHEHQSRAVAVLALFALFSQAACSLTHSASTSPLDSGINAYYFGCGPTTGQSSPQNGLDTIPQPLPHVHHVSGSHEVYIERTVNSETETRMLLIAESLLPSTGEPSPWCSSFDGTKIPRAITADVIHYYLTLIDDFRRGDFTQTNGIEMKRSTLEYTATVSRPARILGLGSKFGASSEETSAGPDVFTVEMTLTWHQYCGSECGLTVTLTRKVTIDHAGNVLSIEGDRCAPKVVS